MSILGSIHRLASGERVTFAAAGLTFAVTYEAEQALGDNGKPARGYTVGTFTVRDEADNYLTSFRHSPHGPSLDWAKPYAAEQAASYITERIFRAQRESNA